MPMPRVLQQLLALPTAPFVEDDVAAFIRQTCRGLRNVTLRADRHGNLLARYRYRPRKRPTLALAAHMDHPGFVARKMLDDRTLLADFHGGVKGEYFANTKLRFWADGQWVRGKLLKVSRRQQIKNVPGWTWRAEQVHVRVRSAVEPGAPGMWDLPEPTLKGDRVMARACDDLAGVGAMLELLRNLSRKQPRGDVYCLFTRAEEVGFVGAIAAAQDTLLPKQTAVLSIETSSTLPSAPIGAGPILRVGDRAAVFSSGLMEFCTRVARDLQKKRKRSFTFQRKLMDGGTCEAAPFITYGYPAAGICLALGNYHNMDTARKKIASEWVSLQDWRQMVMLFEALVTDEQGYDPKATPMKNALEQRYKKYAPLLKSPLG
jgi:putative aminopeptidase FrvX